MKISTLDEDMLGLLPSFAKSPTLTTDGAFRKVQGMVQDVMGPLGKAQASLENHAEKGSLVDPSELLPFVEQAVILLGQTNVIINYNRRLHV